MPRRGCRRARAASRARSGRSRCSRRRSRANYRFTSLRLPVSLPALGLLGGATLWGVVWYPYRLLNAGGIDGLWCTLLTYGWALAAGCLVFRGRARVLLRIPPLAMLMGLAIGWSNL